MSRIGKKAVVLPSGIEAKLDNTKLIISKGKDIKELETYGRVNIAIENNMINFSVENEDRESKAFWGTYRALTNNMVIGLDKGFEKKLEINGVGYRAAIKGKELELNLGFSHPINYPIPSGLNITVDKNIIIVKGSDKQQVGQVSAEIRAFRPPEPYKGKGVKYVDEHIVRKAGKTAKK